MIIPSIVNIDEAIRDNLGLVLVLYLDCPHCGEHGFIVFFDVTEGVVFKHTPVEQDDELCHLCHHEEN